MIKIKQKEDYSKTFDLKYVDTLEGVSLTGCTAYCQMRDVPNGNLVATATCTIDTTNKTVTIQFDGSDLQYAAPGIYGFDVWIKDTSSQNHPIYDTRCEIIGRYTMNF